MTPLYAMTKAQIETYVEEWRTRLDLDHLTFTLRFIEGVNDEDNETLADTKTDWEYRQVHMRWFLPNVSILTPEEIRHVVLHEVIHTLTASIESELSSRHTKACEYAVESLTLAIQHLADTVWSA